MSLFDFLPTAEQAAQGIQSWIKLGTKEKALRLEDVVDLAKALEKEGIRGTLELDHDTGRLVIFLASGHSRDVWDIDEKNLLNNVVGESWIRSLFVRGVKIKHRWKGLKAGLFT